MYFDKVGKYKILTRDKEQELSRKIQEGDVEALNELVSSNLRFVIDIAKEYRNMGLPFADLIQEGNLGLIAAAKKFDPDRELKFITCAVKFIRTSIRSALDNSSRTIRLPKNKIKELSKIHYAKKDLLSKGKEITKESIAEKTGIDIEKITLDYTPETLSIEKLSDEEYFFNKETKKAPMKSFSEETELKKNIYFLLSNLNDQEREVIERRYGLNGYDRETLGEIGETLGYSKEWVRYLENRTIGRLKKTKGIKNLKYFLYQ